MHVGKSIMGIFLALVMLASMGVALAMWSETLRINVTVNTGEVDVAWTEYWHNDTEEKPGLNFTTVSIEPEPSEGDVKKLKVTLNNTYPCYKVGIYGNVTNIGTIPVKLLNATIKYTVDSAVHKVSLQLCTWKGLDLDGDGETEIEVHLGLKEQPLDTQIDPGETDTYELCIHVTQNASESTSYSFELIMVFAQWNEVP